MAWESLPDTVLERLFKTCAKGPTCVCALQQLERRALVCSAAAWDSAAIGYLGAGVCAALVSRAGGPLDWKEVQRKAVAGRLQERIESVPLLCTCDRAARSGHAVSVLSGSIMIVFGGILDGQAVAEPLVFDLVRRCWPSMDFNAPSPSPRIRATLTAQSAAGATLICGQSFQGPGTGTPIDDVWRVECERADGEFASLRWQAVCPSGCEFSARSCHTAVDTPHGLLVIGGVGTAGRTLPCEAYCFGEDDTWILPPQSGLFPPQGALHHACCHRGRVVLAGGVDDAGLQRRGLGRPTELHTLDLSSWVWARLARQPFTPPMHSRAAGWRLGNSLLIVGGDDGGPGHGSSFLAVLNLSSLEWSRGVMTGPTFRAAGHAVAAGVLLGGLRREDPLAPVSLLVPDLSPQAEKGASPTRRASAPRWLKR
mmetsp:Transcript_96886/g.273859  ORF Transcript_96886/g.273859 Transcript_96886/m.273859 type:complete len:425 (-) Transcript_96886:64-1338(-)